MQTARGGRQALLQALQGSQRAPTEGEEVMAGSAKDTPPCSREHGPQVEIVTLTRERNEAIEAAIRANENADGWCKLLDEARAEVERLQKERDSGKGPWVEVTNLRATCDQLREANERLTAENQQARAHIAEVNEALPPGPALTHPECIRRLVTRLAAAEKEAVEAEKMRDALGVWANPDLYDHESIENLISAHDLEFDRAEKAEAWEAKLVEVLEPLVAIANAYDENNLDDEARKFWGENHEHENDTLPKDIELYSGRGGKELLTLDHCLNARAVLENSLPS